ncbi:MAG: hypothetical protein DDT34_00403 [Firmicutes bacterium]|nr:hypothetical protein [Bacillota bacterium]
MVAVWEDLECYLRFDPSRRGFAGLLKAGSLERVACRLEQTKRVAIATGFFIPEAQAIESDGPLGAVFLARALLGTGQEVVLLSPAVGSQALECSQRFLGLTCPVVLKPPGQVEEQLLDELRCDVFVAIEYPGQGCDGECRNMRGYSISAHVPLLDRAFNYAKMQGVFTVAIGDGGNELGCGALAKSVAVAPDGKSIKAATEAEVVLAAGVSNWGAYTLVAALSLLAGINFVPTPREERLLLEQLCAVGVVDGCSGRCEPTVDGIGAEQLNDFLQGLYNYVAENLETQRSVAATSGSSA